MAPPPQIVHASAVALAGRGLLIRGRAGAGKSALALQLMALGAALVSDDRTVLSLEGDEITLSAPDTIAGLIEARGIGILASGPPARAALHAVVDLDRTETERLPPARHVTLLGRHVRVLYKTDHVAFPAALRHYLLSREVT